MDSFTYRGNPASGAPSREPSPSRNELRAQALAAWERRCRGYDLYRQPVELEPAFVPFVPGADAGIGGWDAPAQPLHRDLRRACFRLLLPVEQKVIPQQVGDWLGAFRAIDRPVALEIIGAGGAVIFQLACAEEDAETVCLAFNSAFPLARVETADDALCECPVGMAVDFGLYHPAYQPLKRFDRFAADPLQGAVQALGQVGRAGELAGLQVLAATARGDWGSSLRRMVDEFSAGPDPRSARLRRKNEGPWHRSLENKLESPLWAACVRVFAWSQSGPERAFGLCRSVGRALSACGETGSNELVALDNGGYEDAEHWQDMAERRTRRTGMVLSAAELAGLFHPPSENLSHARLLRHDPRHRPLPEKLRAAEGIALGRHAASGGEIAEGADAVPWPDDYRNRHAYILGATRMGKSTLLLNMASQDMAAGRGLCLIDPHGDLALDALALVPPERAGDALYLDLSDLDFPAALGLFETSDEWERRLLVSDLLSILHRVFRSSWGDRLEHILRNTILTLLADGKPHTLRDIRLLLMDKAYRENVLASVREPDLLAFWHGEFPGYSSSALSPVYNKLGLLLSSPVVSNIVAQPQGKLDFSRLIAERKIVIVNLAQSLIGEDNAHFLGALMVSKLQLAAMHSLRQRRGERREMTLYVDEFQNFVVSSFEKILSEAGKAGFSLVMANQYLEQLGEGLQTAILSNVGLLASFRVSAESGRRLEREFGELYNAKELADQQRGRAVVRFGKATDSFALATFPPPAPPLAGDALAETIVANTRARYCRPRREVEEELAREAASRPRRQEPVKPLPRETKQLKTEAPSRAAAMTGESAATSAEASAPMPAAPLDKDSRANWNAPALPPGMGEKPVPDEDDAMVFGLPDE